MSNTVEYNREYAKTHRAEILRKRKERYWTDPLYRDTILSRTKKSRHINKVYVERTVDSTLKEEDSKVVPIGGKDVKVYNKAAFARLIGVSRPTVYNWHKENILPIPPDVDALGRFWYREDFIQKVNTALGRYKLKPRKEVITERMKRAFSGELHG
jgi:hypothetical protein